ncbi:MAG: hypothetical protein NVSMB26_08410 [Beijerinckiaceae bacterium]
MWSEAAARRNDLAHGIVIATFRNSKKIFFLVPPFQSSKYRDLNAEPEYQYTAKEIAGIRQKFRVLAGDVHRLKRGIFAWQGACPKKPVRQPFQLQPDFRNHNDPQ